MRDAKLPLQYRDSCAHLLIPLNRCRFETWYMPWKCEVRDPPGERRRSRGKSRNKMLQKERRNRNTLSADSPLPQHTGRETQLRKVPVRRVQEARRQDGRAQGGQGRCAEQLRGPGEQRGLAVYIWMREKGGWGLAAIDANALYQTLVLLVFGVFRPWFSVGGATNSIAAPASEHGPAGLTIIEPTAAGTRINLAWRTQINPHA